MEYYTTKTPKHERISMTLKQNSAGEGMHLKDNRPKVTGGTMQYKRYAAGTVTLAPPVLSQPIQMVSNRVKAGLAVGATALGGVGAALATGPAAIAAGLGTAAAGLGYLGYLGYRAFRGRQNPPAVQNAGDALDAEPLVAPEPVADLAIAHVPDAAIEEDEPVPPAPLAFDDIEEDEPAPPDPFVFDEPAPLVAADDGAPLGFLERQKQRERDEAAFKRSQRSGASGASSKKGKEAVTLTKQEEADISAAAIARSKKFSNHGRAAHGPRASAASPSTTAAADQRSQEVAARTAIAAELQRRESAAKKNKKKDD